MMGWASSLPLDYILSLLLPGVHNGLLQRNQDCFGILLSKVFHFFVLLSMLAANLIKRALLITYIPLSILSSIQLQNPG